VDGGQLHRQSLHGFSAALLSFPVQQRNFFLKAVLPRKGKWEFTKSGEANQGMDGEGSEAVFFSHHVQGMSIIDASDRIGSSLSILVNAVILLSGLLLAACLRLALLEGGGGEKKENVKIGNSNNKKELVSIHAEARWDLFFCLNRCPAGLFYATITTCTIDANVILRLWIILLMV
jgi:hypothetical protein